MMLILKFKASPPSASPAILPKAMNAVSTKMPFGFYTSLKVLYQNFKPNWRYPVKSVISTANLWKL
jgi:hypothetical protein